MLLAGAANAPASEMLDAMAETFSAVCLTSDDLAEQHRVAEALPNMSKEVVSGFKNRQRVIPGVHYSAPNKKMRVSIFGYSGAGVCSVAGRFAKTLSLPDYLAAVEKGLNRKPAKRLKIGNFYRGGWVAGSRDIDVEWSIKNDEVIALMSVRKRDGYSR